MPKTEAIKATATGNVQQVGFRALVMKQAIQYNLAGLARNDADGIVIFTLQGDKHQIDLALATIQQGTARSSDINVTGQPEVVDPNLESFTIVDWTSSRRNITNKYNLVFQLRPDDNKISADEAEKTWHKILKSTLSPEDLAKLHPDD